MTYPVITIGREFGSGGRVVAQRVAEALDIPFYDKAVIDLAAQETGLSKEFIRQAEQKKASSLLYSLYMSTQSLPINDQIYLAESEVIRRVAQEGPCVIVGRCGDYVLRDHPNALHVFIHAPLEQRILQAREQYHLDTPDIRNYVIKQDKARASYYNHFTDGTWGKVQNYHLSLSTALGIDTAVALILSAAKSRQTD